MKGLFGLLGLFGLYPAVKDLLNDIRKQIQEKNCKVGIHKPSGHPINYRVLLTGLPVQGEPWLTWLNRNGHSDAISDWPDKLIDFCSKCNYPIKATTDK